MSPRRNAADWTKAETDVADVMMWLLSNHGQELSYDDIGKGVGITSKPRLQRAVRLVRVIAADRGDRLGRFMPSADPKRRRVFTTPATCAGACPTYGTAGPGPRSQGTM